MINKKRIANWWSKNPMTYGLKHGSTVYKSNTDYKNYKLGTKKFFNQADQILYDWNKPLHNNKGYFGKIFTYDKYKDLPVLEIGCGMGCMSMLWAQSGSKVTAVDLSPVSIKTTKKRFEAFGLKGIIKREDANALSFKDASFNYVYSWGVLHHSPNLKQSISELFRVLKPGGGFGVMLYHRNSLLYWYQIKYTEGILHNESKFLNNIQLASRYSDGYREEGNPHTWPITKKEVKKIFSPYTNDISIKLLGTELDSIFRHMFFGFYFFIPKTVKKVWARRFGWSIWISGTKDVD